MPLPPFALHKAVFDDDAERLQSLLMRAGAAAALESLDGAKNTPLLLAYRMGRVRCARMLLAAGAFPKPRTPEGFESIHVAALTGNPDLVRTAVLAFLAETDAALERRMPALQAALSALPDFCMRISWAFSSWVPLVSGLLPGDAWYISKRGSSLRLDSTLLGMQGLRCVAALARALLQLQLRHTLALPRRRHRRPPPPSPPAPAHAQLGARQPLADPVGQRDAQARRDVRFGQ